MSRSDTNHLRQRLEQLVFLQPSPALRVGLDEALHWGNSKNFMQTTRIPDRLVWIVVAICLVPSLLNLLGFDFSSPLHPFDASLASTMHPRELVEAMHYSLAGSFTHTILEWSAFCTAIFIVILSFIHFVLKRDAVTPIIGMSLFCAGCMDAFHTLAADRLIEGIADNQNLIPFTWVICRLFNALILIGGAGILLMTKPGKSKGGVGFVAIASLVFSLIAYVIVYICAHSATLPPTIFPNSIITRPWDVAPLLLFIFAGIYVFPRLYHLHPSLFSHGLVISIIPQIATQLHMVFGSNALFDNHFNIAHFLKILAYIIPFIGLTLEYIRTYTEEALSVERLEEAHTNLIDKTKQLETTNKALETEIKQRNKIEAALFNTKAELEKRVEERTAELKHTNDMLIMEVSERKQNETLFREKSQELQIALCNLQNTQSQLIQTEKISSLGQLVAGVAHEINNPVSFIYGNINHANQYAQDLLHLLEVYEQEYPKPTPRICNEIEAIDIEFLREDFPKLLDSMQIGVERICEIVSSLRSFSRVDRAEMQAVNIHQGIDSTLLILQHRLKATNERPAIKTIKNYADLPLVECYPGQLNQVFMNLLSNAIDALEESFLIQPNSFLVCGNIQPPTIKISTAIGAKNKAIISIADNGCGMTEEVRQRLFDAFYTTKPVGKGTGLGLSISYQIVVEKHLGSLQCISSPEKGAEFIISIPICQNLEQEASIEHTVETIC